MAQKTTKSNKGLISDRVLLALLEDPTRSVRDIADSLKTYRQKVWRRKRELEEDGAVWGYTAVLDEGKLGHVLYLVLMKTRPMSMGLARLLTKRVAEGEPAKQQVRLINVLYVNGEYDWVVMFSAPDHATARRYYDSLRVAYGDHLLDKPAIIDVNFSAMREGKVNPSIEELLDFVPL